MCVGAGGHGGDGQVLAGLVGGPGLSLTTSSAAGKERGWPWAWYSMNHSPQFGRAVIPSGELLAVGIGSSLTVPDVVIRPIWLPVYSVNHSAPSGPAVISLAGGLPRWEWRHSVTVPVVVTRPILLWSDWVDHSALSGPAVIRSGWLRAVGIVNSVIAPGGAPGPADWRLR